MCQQQPPGMQHGYVIETVSSRAIPKSASVDVDVDLVCPDDLFVEAGVGL